MTKAAVVEAKMKLMTSDDNLMCNIIEVSPAGS